MGYKEFAEQFKNDETLRNEYQAFMKMKDPQNDEEGYAVFIEFAASKGYSVTVEDIAMEKAMNRTLDETELQAVSGGRLEKCTSNYDTKCSDTFKPGENCWHNDECDFVYHYYHYHEVCDHTADGRLCVALDECILFANIYT